MFADELISLLVEAGVGVAGTTIFLGSKASLPATGVPAILTVAATGGASPEGTHNSTTIPAYTRPSAQIVARGINYADAEALIQAAYLALFSIRNRYVNGTWWRQVMIKQEPFDLGEDVNARPRLAFNIDVIRRYSPINS